MAMTVEELIAREEIRTSILRHFRAADRLDIELERKAFWEDGHFINGPVEGPLTEFIGPLFGEILPGSFDLVMHYAQNMLITLEGDAAFVELYATAYHAIADDPAVIAGVIGEAKFAEFGNDASRRYEMLVGVRYVIVMQRRSGEWRIYTMQPIIEWTRVQHCDAITVGGLPAAMPTKACKDRGDASYFGKDWIP